MLEKQNTPTMTIRPSSDPTTTSISTATTVITIAIISITSVCGAKLGSTIGVHALGICSYIWKGLFPYDKRLDLGWVKCLLNCIFFIPWNVQSHNSQIWAILNEPA